MRRTHLLALVSFACLVVVVGSPIELSYATSGSMEPTIHRGDGYVVVPANDVEPGNIIMFRQIDGEGFVTHRVVEQTDEGYWTRGDANPTPDQAAGHPPVSSDRIVGTALTVGGTPLTLPLVGPVAKAVSDHFVAIVAGLVAAGAALEVRRNQRTRSRRTHVRVGGVIIAVAVGCLLISSLFVLASVQHRPLPADGGADRADGADTAGSATQTYEVQVLTSRLTDSTFAATGARVVRTTVVGSSSRSLFGVSNLRRDQTVRVTVRIPSDSEGGGDAPTLSVYPYPTVLPERASEWGHRIHPLVPTLASAVAVFGPILGAAWLLVDPRRPLRLNRPAADDSNR